MKRESEVERKRKQRKKKNGLWKEVRKEGNKEMNQEEKKGCKEKRELPLKQEGEREREIKQKVKME